MKPSDWLDDADKQHSGKPDLKIDAVYAFIAEGEEGEGVMGAMFPNPAGGGPPVMMPLVGADEARIRSLKKAADEIAEQSGFPYKIYKFDNKTDVTNEFDG